MVIGGVKMRSFKVAAFASGMMTLACAASVHAAVYTQTFDRAGSINANVSTVGWASYNGSSATLYTEPEPNTGTPRTGLGHTYGNPNTTPKGYLYSAGVSSQVTAAVNGSITPVVNVETIS